MSLYIGGDEGGDPLDVIQVQDPGSVTPATRGHFQFLRPYLTNPAGLYTLVIQFSRLIERMITLIPRVALWIPPMFVPLKMAPGQTRGLSANQWPAFVSCDVLDFNNTG